MNVDRGLIGHFGLPGSGKTHGLRQSVFRAVEHGTTVIVFARMPQDWAQIPRHWPDGAAIQAPDLGTARRLAEEGARLIVIGGPVSLDELDEAAKWTIERGERAVGVGDERGIAIAEAHRVIDPQTRLPRYLDDVVSGWRHYGANLWVDSQRIGRVRRDLTENLSIVRIFAVRGDRDRQVVRDLGGRELEEAALECARILGRSGKSPPPPEDAGWHVELRQAGTPPYPIVRMKPDGSLERLKRRGQLGLVG